MALRRPSVHRSALCGLRVGVRHSVVGLVLQKDAPWAHLSLESRRAVVLGCEAVAVFCIVGELLTELRRNVRACSVHEVWISFFLACFKSALLAGVIQEFA